MTMTTETHDRFDVLVTPEQQEAALAYLEKSRAGIYPPLSNRAREWYKFHHLVFRHIQDYTVPQYGDMPDDQMTTASIEAIKHDMTRYINRMGTNARGASEGLRDMLKLAHYACIAHAKLQENADA